MVFSCGVCGDSVARRQESLQCSSCVKSFHSACLKITSSDLEIILKGKESWKCGSCTKMSVTFAKVKTCISTRNNPSGDTPAPLDSGSNNQQLTSEQSKIDSLLERVIKLQEEQKEVMKVINSNHDLLLEHNKRIGAVEDKLDGICQRLDGLEAENASLRSRLAESELRVNLLDQESRRNTLEIHGIPYKGGESLWGLLFDIGAALGYKVCEQDIDYIYRQRSRPHLEPSRPPAIIVRFVRQTVRNELLRLRKVKRNFSTRSIGWNEGDEFSIYINESLTLYNKKVYAALRELKKDDKVKYVWVNGGKVLARKQDGSPVIVIKSADDLNLL